MSPRHGKNGKSGLSLKTIAGLLVVVLAASSAIASAQGTSKVQRAKAQSRSQKQRPQIPPALRMALAAVGKVRYQGKRVIEGKVGGTRQRHVEIVVTDGQRSRIEFPSDSPLASQVIVETPDERRHFMPDKNELQIMPPRREEAFKGIREMANRGLIEQLPGGTIAGFPTELVVISDRRANVLQKLWIEPRSGMILKRELYDRSGAIEASFEFTEISFQPVINRSLFVLEPNGANRVTPELKLRTLIRRGGFQAVHLPRETQYRLQGARIQKIAEQQVLVQQYSGKGHRILLYQIKGSVDPTKLGKLERPELQIYTWQSNGSSFVLLGDVPDAELRELGRRLGG
jgi:outer membrane lipoprotein-sorting protein